MAKITMPRPVTIQYKDGEVFKTGDYAAGEYEITSQPGIWNMPQAAADHWMVKALATTPPAGEAATVGMLEDANTGMAVPPRPVVGDVSVNQPGTSAPNPSPDTADVTQDKAGIKTSKI